MTREIIMLVLEKPERSRILRSVFTGSTLIPFYHIQRGPSRPFSASSVPRFPRRRIGQADSFDIGQMSDLLIWCDDRLRISQAPSLIDFCDRDVVMF
jgi:hypothetical protein